MFLTDITCQMLHNSRRNILSPWTIPKLACVLNLNLFCFRWNISVVYLTVALKLTKTLFFSLYFQTFWPKWLNFFSVISKTFRSMTEKKQTWTLCRSILTPTFYRYGVLWLMNLCKGKSRNNFYATEQKR